MSSLSNSICSSCGSCCRSYIVPLCGYDVWLISAQLRLRPEQFAVVCPEMQPSTAGFRLTFAGPTHTLALNKQGRFEPSQPCIFLLSQADGRSRCGIYAHRPSVCRAYPMVLSADAVALRDTNLCPPGAWSAQEVRQPAWRGALQRGRMHADIYAYVVARWNVRLIAAGQSADFPLQEYFTYLLAVYDRLAALAADIGPELEAKVQSSWPTAVSGDIGVGRGEGQIAPLWSDYLLETRQVIDCFYPEVTQVDAPVTAVPDSGTVHGSSSALAMSIATPAPLLLGLGDSVAVGYGLGPADGTSADNGKAYPALLASQLGMEYHNLAAAGACAASSDGPAGTSTATSSCASFPDLAAQIQHAVTSGGRPPTVITLMTG